MIKIHTLIKGLIWELIGCVILSVYTWISTGNWQAALQIGIGYPALRVILWYPYERAYKRIRRRKYTGNSGYCVQTSDWKPPSPHWPDVGPDSAE